MLRMLFTDHPRAIGESYVGHLRHASGFGLRMIAGGAACIVHGLVPGLFVKTGSATVRALYRDMQPRSERAEQAAAIAQTQFLPEYEI